MFCICPLKYDLYEILHKASKEVTLTFSTHDTEVDGRRITKDITENLKAKFGKFNASTSVLGRVGVLNTSDDRAYYSYRA